MIASPHTAWPPSGTERDLKTIAVDAANGARAGNQPVGMINVADHHAPRSVNGGDCLRYLLCHLNKKPPVRIMKVAEPQLWNVETEDGPVFLVEKRQILKMMVDVEGKQLLTLPLFLKAAATTQPDTLLTGGSL